MQSNKRSKIIFVLKNFKKEVRILIFSSEALTRVGPWKYWSIFFTIIWMLLNLSRGSLGVPVSAHGDLIYFYATMDAYRRNFLGIEPNIGFPFGLHMGSVPLVDWFQQPLIIAISHFLGTVSAANLWWALSFPLTAALSWRLGSMYTNNVVLTNTFALAVTFSPWHMFRGDHILLGTTWPIVVILILMTKLIKSDGSNPSTKKSFFVLAVITGLFSSYLGFFALLCTAGIFLGQISYSLLKRKIDKTGITIQVGIIQFVTYLATLLPTVYYRYQDSNQMSDPFARSSNESILYAGSIFRLISPYFPSLENFSIKLLGNFFELPGSTESLKSSNFAPPLLSIGLILMVILAIRLKIPTRTLKREVFLIGTTILWLLAWFLPGGLNFLFANEVTPQIRSWNRLAPFIQLLLLIIFVTIFENYEKIDKSRTFNRKISYFLLLITSIAIPNPLNFGGHKDGSAKFREMVVLVNQITSEQQGTCGTLQLPLSDFPEVGPKGYAQDYDQFWPYLINSEFKGSYGVLKSSKENVLTKYDEEYLLSSEGVSLLKKAGFCGILVDTLGYNEPPKWLDAFKVHADSKSSKSGQYIYRSIGKSSESKPSVLLKNHLSFANGFSFLESQQDQRWIWVMNSTAKISFYVTSPTLASISFRSSLNECKNPMRIKFYLNGKQFSKVDLDKNDQEVDFRKLMLIKGVNEFHIKSQGDHCKVKSDERTFYWRMIDPTIYLGEVKVGF